MDVAVYSDGVTKLLLTNTPYGIDFISSQKITCMTITAVSKHSTFSKNLGPILYRDGVTNWK